MLTTTRHEAPALEPWLTTQQAAELASYHPEHIRRLLRSGDVTGRKWGTSWQVNRDSFLAYLEQIETQGERRGPKVESLDRG
ncbi:MAG: helix-turn-helix domain-containing protein [Anaerolineales bacterium]|nr:helix-turn-helix domain-containing protein [Anaerolineales bacterium]